MVDYDTLTASHHPTSDRAHQYPPDRDEAVRDEVATFDECAALVSRLQTQIKRVFIGQDEVVKQVLTACLAGGHVLLRGVPGLAKTLLIKTLAQAVSLKFSRVQFTPDLMPSDIVGTEVIEEDRGTGKRVIRFIPGPIFANILLADEINRTPPKTQAALLEAMQEQQVTVNGVRYALTPPFFVLASGEDVMRARALVRELPAAENVIDYATRLVRATRPAGDASDHAPQAVRQFVKWGAGPRAGQALLLGGKANALLDGRAAVALEDIQTVARPVLRHRMLLNFQAEAEGIDADEIVSRLLEGVPPR
jgi:MoxR-like ATPase